MTANTTAVRAISKRFLSSFFILFSFCTAGWLIHGKGITAPAAHIECLAAIVNVIVSADLP